MRIAAALIATLELTVVIAPPALAQQRFPLAASGQPSGQVFNPVFSPDSDQLAALHTLLTAKDDPAAGKGQVSRVSIWDVATRKILAWLECLQPGGSHHVPRLAYSPDGNWLALAEHDGCVRLWNTSNWAASTVTFPAADEKGLPGDGAGPSRPECSAVAFSPDSRQVAVLTTRHGKDDSCLVWIRDVPASKSTATLKLEGHPAAVAWQSEDRLALVVNIAEPRRSSHCELQEWNVRGAGSDESLPVLARRQNLGDGPAIAAFAPDAQTLAYAAGSNIALYSIRSGDFRRLGSVGNYYGSRVPNYRAGVTALAFSPDGAALAAGGNALQTHTRLRLFALRSQTFDFDPDAFDHGAGYATTNIAFSKSGEYLATAVHRWAGAGSESLFLWHLTTAANQR